MKNAINYYYNLYPDNIHQANKQFRFMVNNEKYFLLPFQRNPEDINYLYDVCLQLLQRNIYCHQIVMNIDKKLITIINNNPYVLLKVYVDNHQIVTINDIILFSNNAVNLNFNNILKRDNWYQLWTQKIDYFEYQVSQFGKSFPLIRESFSYFVGLAETGILLLKNIPNENNTLTIAHKRIKNNYTLFELYNPLNFIVDLKIRDASEFFKERFFKIENTEKKIFEEIRQYLTYSNLTVNETIMFFIRMFFPSFYFDLYEDIITEGLNENELLRIIDRINEYEELLKELYLYLKQYINIPDIEWLIKNVK